MEHITIATRRSPLALAQTGWVAATLRGAGHRVSLLELVTTGDRWSAAGSADATRGLFVKELEEALLDGRADIAVHSAKDLPGDLPDGLDIVAVPQRADPRDVVVGAPDGLAGLEHGAIVGTGSPRRVAQLRRRYPHLEFREIRGNVETRIAKRDSGDFDAIILAAAGLNRLGITPAHSLPLDVADCVPAPGQGALAIEGLADRGDLTDALVALQDAATRRCLLAERAVLAGLGGGCREPVGALAVVEGDGLRLDVFAATPDGTRSVRDQARIGPGHATIESVVEAIRDELA